MQFSSAINEKYDEADGQLDCLNVNYSPITIIDRIADVFCSITVLSLNHCNLTTLRGMQQFPHLKLFSFKFNEIICHRELEFLTCRETLVEMNFIGNDIEHLQACRYQKLVVDFPNLAELNNTDYRFKRILKERNQATDRNIHIKRVLNRLDKLTTRVNIDEEDRRDTVQGHHLPDISISRVEMVKSVVKPEQPACKKRQLLISTANTENVQVYQPTATFAKQKTFETVSQAFNFRKQTSHLMQLLERRDEQELGCSRSAMGSVVIFPELKEQVEQHKEDLAEANYLKNLTTRVFYSWLFFFRKSLNMPKRKEF